MYQVSEGYVKICSKVIILYRYKWPVGHESSAIKVEHCVGEVIIVCPDDNRDTDEMQLYTKFQKAIVKTVAKDVLCSKVGHYKN